MKTCPEKGLQPLRRFLSRAFSADWSEMKREEHPVPIFPFLCPRQHLCCISIGKKEQAVKFYLWTAILPVGAYQ